MSLKGKSAIVTGSTSGIGRAVAEAFAAEGCNVMLNGFGDPAAIAKLQQEMAKKNGVRVEYDGADMSKPAEIADLVAKAQAAFGAVDILVNNAGIQFTAPIEQFPIEKWDAIIAINLSATFHAIRAALPAMKARKWGRIINIASTHGLVASTHKVAYVAAKHGIVGLTKVVGMECADTGVTCNAICPGWVLTPLVQAQIDARAKEQGIPVEQAAKNLLAEKQPQLQFTKPEQIAGLAVFLASDTASNMQGTQLVSDGGWTAQ
ncbi:3-hydroxybutyrate dehydrogenase [Enhydrobacter aerosaccus]|uniref:3-hydroxybutyrate dehydrogenase n=1 Tax=Enhydrobacter aerosaccus TaxID=225324 RepID=A0A1T4RZ33_9HYPH|nr:3-hydroxybutyrate dehydrogenase [Enhydrobacter aerosaccus]SKA21205.1 3-hydroxybutyrate dehydrogenase [Enhydrobacter aerosaccus]